MSLFNLSLYIICLSIICVSIICPTGPHLDSSHLVSSLPPGQPCSDQSSCEVTLLNHLNQRRTSTTSTSSSAYTLSRRSSGISPCYSSRRSSEASQFGTGRHNNNISSADSYDPISTDLSRRSSEASQGGGGGVGGGGGGLPSILSLTPAQHYRLKAKYAAATGGAPPTPLPNMNQMNLRTRVASDGTSIPFLQPPGGAAPRRCSDIGYTARTIMHHEAPTSLPRRASDPVRQTRPENLSFSRIQRYNSTSNLRPITGPERWNRSDGSRQQYPFAPRPPSISENVAREDGADRTRARGGQNQEEDLVLPDDVVQYLRSQNSGPPGTMSWEEHHSNRHQGASPPPAPFYTQRKMAAVDGTTVPAELVKKNTMPVQWNEVSSGSVDATNQVSRNQQQVLRGNLAVVQQRQNFGPFQTPGQGLVCNQRLLPLSQGYLNQQRHGNSATFSQGLSPNQGYDREAAQNFRAGTMRPAHSEGSDLQTHWTRAETSVRSHGNQVEPQRKLFQPRPPTEPMSTVRQHTGPNSTLRPSQVPESTDGSRDYGSSEASPKRPSWSVSHNGACENPNSAVFYMGHIQMFEPTTFGFDSPLSPGRAAAPTNMASPGVNQVSSSTVDSEHAPIDFETLLDDEDHSSLMSGTLSPGLFQSLSRTSSRLTTPGVTVALASVPPVTGNMAIGDMNSMLTALAEESKFLNMMS